MLYKDKDVNNSELNTLPNGTYQQKGLAATALL